MKLQNSLYNITGRETAEDGGMFHLHLNQECFIYKAHFPGQPVTPGVCVTQIAVELAEAVLGHGLEMTGIRNVKFLAVMAPSTQTEVAYHIMIKGYDDSDIRIQAVAQSKNEVYAKMSLICRKRQVH